MALETVKIRVVTDDLAEDSVDNVNVRVFDATGTTLQTFGTTGAVTQGEVDFTLLGATVPVEYQLRFYMQGVGFTSPQLIQVYSPASFSPTGTNIFQVRATIADLPQASNPYLCRISGVVRDGNGAPKPGNDLHFIPMFRPSSIGGDLVVGERVTIRSNREGYVEFDLYRKGCYNLMLEGHDHMPLYVMVPDRASIRLSDLILPVVASVEWDPPGPWTIAEGGTLEVRPTATASNYQELTGIGLSDIVYSSEDSAIVSVSVGADSLTLRGISPGATFIKATPKPGQTAHEPEAVVSGDTVGVTVS